MRALSLTFTTIIVIIVLAVTLVAILSIFRTGFTSAAEPVEGASEGAGESVRGFIEAFRETLGGQATEEAPPEGTVASTWWCVQTTGGARCSDTDYGTESLCRAECGPAADCECWEKQE